jgi:hypothetical protein
MFLTIQKQIQIFLEILKYPSKQKILYLLHLSARAYFLADFFYPWEDSQSDYFFWLNKGEFKGK